jgi:hypothetical protein
MKNEHKTELAGRILDALLYASEDLEMDSPEAMAEFIDSFAHMLAFHLVNGNSDNPDEVPVYTPAQVMEVLETLRPFHFSTLRKQA